MFTIWTIVIICVELLEFRMKIRIFHITCCKSIGMKYTHWMLRYHVVYAEQLYESLAWFINYNWCLIVNCIRIANRIIVPLSISHTSPNISVQIQCSEFVRLNKFRTEIRLELESDHKSQNWFIAILISTISDNDVNKRGKIHWLTSGW